MTQFLHDRLLEAFASALAAAVGQPVDAVRAQVKPAEPEHGDLGFPTFPLAKQLRTAPPKIAAELAGKLSVPGLQISAAGPYVNARFETRAFMAFALGIAVANYFAAVIPLQFLAQLVAPRAWVEMFDQTQVFERQRGLDLFLAMI